MNLCTVWAGRQLDEAICHDMMVQPMRSSAYFDRAILLHGNEISVNLHGWTSYQWFLQVRCLFVELQDHNELQLDHLSHTMEFIIISFIRRNFTSVSTLPSANLLYGGSLWHALAAFVTSNSTQYLKIL